MDETRQALERVERVLGEFQDTVRKEALDSSEKYSLIITLLEHELSRIYFKAAMTRISMQINGGVEESGEIERLRGAFRQLAEARKETKEKRKLFTKGHLREVVEILGYKIE
jgi:hypothetical protein